MTTDKPAIRPAPLKSGDTIEIVAPAGPIEHPRDLERGATTLQQMGFRVRYSRRIFESYRYLAGKDNDRAQELMRAFEDPGVKAIMSLRGGYGCSRLVDSLDTRRLRNRCKIFVGFSDLTTLHLYFRKKLGWVTFHGPMATSAVLATDPLSTQLKHLHRLLTDPAYLPEFSFPELETLVPGSAVGELAGGCLSILVASLRTKYELATGGKILFLEELGEQPYRIDRMLTQLKSAQKFTELKGLVLGEFRECTSPSSEYSLKDVILDTLGNLGLPVLANFPAGHGPENWALPLGTTVRLDASNRSLQFLEPALSGEG